jgi:hypothetical protein
MQNVKLLQDVSAGCCASTTSNLVYSLLSWATGLVVMVTRGSACFDFSSAGCGARCKVPFFLKLGARSVGLNIFCVQSKLQVPADLIRLLIWIWILNQTHHQSSWGLFYGLTKRKWEMIAGSLASPAMFSVRTVAWCSADWMKLWSRFFSAVFCESWVRTLESLWMTVCLTVLQEFGT